MSIPVWVNGGVGVRRSGGRSDIWSWMPASQLATNNVFYNNVRNHRTAINGVVSSLVDGIMCHAISLMVMLPVMKLEYEENSNVAVLRYDQRMLDFEQRG